MYTHTCYNDVILPYDIDIIFQGYGIMLLYDIIFKHDHIKHSVTIWLSDIYNK